jgi:hypothetical protein
MCRGLMRPDWELVPWEYLEKFIGILTIFGKNVSQCIFEMFSHSNPPNISLSHC